MKSADAIGRRTRRSTDVDYNIVYTPLALPGFEFLLRHGFANTAYLYDHYRLLRRQDRTYLQKLIGRMRRGDYLCTPLEDSIFYSNNKFQIYKGTERMVRALQNEGHDTDVIRVSQNRLHDYGTACVTGSIELGFRKAGIEYVPGHFFLKRANTRLAYFPEKEKSPTPDQLFAGNYDGKPVLYVVEMDMGTEQRSYAAERKSYDSMIDCLEQYVNEERYRDHLKVKSPMKALVVFAERAAELSFHKRLAKKYRKCPFILTRTISSLKPRLIPEPPDYTLVSEGWNRHGYQEPYYINRA